MNSQDTWSPRNIYLYVVCLVTLVMVIFATVNLVRTVAEFFYPEPHSVVYPVRVPGSPEGAPEMDQKQLEEQREIQRRWALRRSVLNLVGNGTLLLLAGPLYLYHWRKIEAARVAAKRTGREDVT